MSDLIIEVQVKYTEVAKKLKTIELRKANPSDSGFDLQAAIEQPILFFHGERKIIPSGIHIQMPLGWEAQVRSRSGMSLKGLTVGNSPGTIDHLYRSEIGIILMYTGTGTFEVMPGMKIAQLCFNMVPNIKLYRVDELIETGRGGFGSTGV